MVMPFAKKPTHMIYGFTNYGLQVNTTINRIAMVLLINQMTTENFKALKNIQLTLRLVH